MANYFKSNIPQQAQAFVTKQQTPDQLVQNMTNRFSTGVSNLNRGSAYQQIQASEAQSQGYNIQDLIAYQQAKKDAEVLETAQRLSEGNQAAAEQYIEQVNRAREAQAQQKQSEYDTWQNAQAMSNIEPKKEEGGIKWWHIALGAGVVGGVAWYLLKEDKPSTPQLPRYNPFLEYDDDDDYEEEEEEEELMQQIKSKIIEATKDAKDKIKDCTTLDQVNEIDTKLRALLDKLKKKAYNIDVSYQKQIGGLIKAQKDSFDEKAIEKSTEINESPETEPSESILNYSGIEDRISTMKFNTKKEKVAQLMSNIQNVKNEATRVRLADEFNKQRIKDRGTQRIILTPAKQPNQSIPVNNVNPEFQQAANISNRIKNLDNTTTQEDLNKIQANIFRLSNELGRNTLFADLWTKMNELKASQTNQKANQKANQNSNNNKSKFDEIERRIDQIQKTTNSNVIANIQHDIEAMPNETYKKSLSDSLSKKVKEVNQTQEKLIAEVESMINDLDNLDAESMKMKKLQIKLNLIKIDGQSIKDKLQQKYDQKLQQISQAQRGSSSSNYTERVKAISNRINKISSDISPANYNSTRANLVTIQTEIANLPQEEQNTQVLQQRLNNHISRINQAIIDYNNAQKDSQKNSSTNSNSTAIGEKFKSQIENIQKGLRSADIDATLGRLKNAIQRYENLVIEIDLLLSEVKETKKYTQQESQTVKLISLLKQAKKGLDEAKNQLKKSQ